MRPKSIAAAIGVTLLATAASAADIGWYGWGPRVGLSSDPDQVIGGAQFDLGEFTRNLRFQPSAEIGFGDDMVSFYGNAMTAYYFPVRLDAFEYTPLTEPFPVFDFDFVNGAIVPQRKQIEVRAQRDGTAQCVIFWFHMQLDQENAISNEPGSTTHWEQALQCLGTEVEVRAGEKLVIDAEHDCYMIRFKSCEAKK